MKTPIKSAMRRIAYTLYALSAMTLVTGVVLSVMAQPVEASTLASPTLVPGASVSFTVGNHSICVYQSTTITANGTVTLPQGMTATLQTQFFIKNPPDLSTINNPTYNFISNVSNGSTFTITGQWPGIRPTDTVVEIHFGAILLDPVTQNPISQGVGLDIYWYPYVCTVPPTVTNTPVTPSPTTSATDTPTATAAASETPTLTLTPTITNTLPPGVTPTLTNTPTITATASNTPVATSTPTATSTEPVGVTPTLTNTPFSPTTTSTAPSGVTPSSTSPSGATPTTPSGATATPLSTLPAPAATGTPSALIPVTGADLSGQVAPVNLHQRVFLDAGVALLGLAFVFHGLSLKGKRE